MVSALLVVLLFALPPLPSSIRSPLGQVPVVVVADLQCNDEPALGCFDVEQRRIAIKDSVPLIVQWQALFHEEVHLILWDSGHSTHDAAEEGIADAIATARAADLLARFRP